MSTFLACTILLLLLQYNCASTDSNLKWDILKDLQQRNISCSAFGVSCFERRKDDTLNYRGCQCGAICAQYGTCCIDSTYTAITPPKFRPTCRSLDRERSFYMVDRCPPDSPWKVLCEEEWNGDDDVMKFVPVTSLFSLITYKNYFCFRCHESNDDFRSWIVQLQSNSEVRKSIGKKNPVSLTYDRYHQTWMAPVGLEGPLIAVVLDIIMPSEIVFLAAECDSELISCCSDWWSDEDVRKKCEAYYMEMHIERNGTRYKYSNPHCAFCNFEDVGELSCAQAYGKHGYGYAKIPFSFTYLIDINRADGDLVGKIQRCKSTHVWDPYTEKCRELMCAIPGYVLRNGKCEEP